MVVVRVDRGLKEIEGIRDKESNRESLSDSSVLGFSDIWKGLSAFLIIGF